MFALVAPADGQTRPDVAARRANPGNLVGHGGPVKAIQVSGDGTRALTGSFDYSAILWDITVEPPKQLLRLDGHNAAVNAVVFVNGTTRALTAGDDSIVRLWDLATGKLIRAFEGHDAGSKIVGLSVARDGRPVETWAVSSGWDRTARLWNLETLQPGPILREHTGPVNAAVFAAPDARPGTPKQSSHVVTASADGTVRMFRADTGASVRDIAKLGQSVNALHRLSSSDRDLILRAGGRTEARQDFVVYGTVAGQSGIVDLRSGETVRTLPETNRPILALGDVTRVRSNHDSAEVRNAPYLFAIASGDGRVRVFSEGDPHFLEEYRHPFGPVWALALVPRFDDKPQRLYYAGLDDFVSLWQVAPRKPFEEVDASQYPRRFQQTGKPDDPLAKGELQFARKCSICHTLTPDGANRAGPTLHGVFGRRIATLAGYNFSPELKTLDITWNAETIAKLFELGPDKFTPGSKMPLQVMADKGERDALVAFLEQATRP